MAHISKYYSNCKKDNVFCKTLIEQGIVRVTGSNLLITQETLDRNIKQFEGQAVRYQHGGPVIGKINEIFFNGEDGTINKNGGIYKKKGWTAIYTIDKQALIDNGLSLEEVAKMDLSTSFYPKYKGQRTLYNGVECDDEITDFTGIDVSCVFLARFNAARNIVENTADDRVELVFIDNSAEEEEKKEEEKPAEENKQEEAPTEGEENKQEEEKPAEEDKPEEAPCKEEECKGSGIIDVKQLQEGLAQLTQIMAQVEELKKVVLGQQPQQQEQPAPVEEQPQVEEPKQEEQAIVEEGTQPANEQQQEENPNIDTKNNTTPAVAEEQQPEQAKSSSVIDGDQQEYLLKLLNNRLTPEEKQRALTILNPVLNLNNISFSTQQAICNNSAEIDNKKEEKIIEKKIFDNSILKYYRI